MAKETHCAAIIILPTERYSNSSCGTFNIGSMCQKKNTRQGSLFPVHSAPKVDQQPKLYSKGVKPLSSMMVNSVLKKFNEEQRETELTNCNSAQKMTRRSEVYDKQIIELSDISDFDLNNSSHDDDDDDDDYNKTENDSFFDDDD